MHLLRVVSVAAALTAPPPCSARDLRPRVDTNGAGGTIIVYATLRNTSGRACTARGRLVVSLRDAATHRLLAVRGNPRVQPVRGRMRAGRNDVVWLQWENYCGPGRPMLFDVAFGGRHATQRSAYPGARCDTRGQPSRLRLFVQ
jgi:uncharacterized protein DUF4232